VIFAPQVAGDFCRRFASNEVERLMNILNEAHLRVWKHQPETFFEEAFIDADGTFVRTDGRCPLTPRVAPNVGTIGKRASSWLNSVGSRAFLGSQIDEVLGSLGLLYQVAPQVAVRRAIGPNAIPAAEPLHGRAANQVPRPPSSVSDADEVPGPGELSPRKARDISLRASESLIRVGREKLMS
jgi:hypothetical protein